MVKKISLLVVWIAITVLYVWLCAETGRSDGVSTQDAIEDYSQMAVEYFNEEHADAEKVTNAFVDSWSYSYFDNLGKRYSTNYGTIAGQTVAYVVITILCYHFAFIHKKKE